MAASAAPGAAGPAHRAPNRRALLLIDFINPLDFPGAEKLAPRALRAAQAAAGLRRRLAARGVPVIYANDNYGTWQSDFFALLADCLARGGAAGGIAQLLMPRPGDIAVLKPRHSAFFASPLDLLLQSLGARELVLCGLATDMCVQLSAADAFLRGYRLWVPADCSAAETAPAHAASLRYMRTVLRARVEPAGPAPRADRLG